MKDGDNDYHEDCARSGDDGCSRAEDPYDLDFFTLQLKQGYKGADQA